jgi:NAD(P)H-dependent flavin oxidoreductase YrpB (nitropropane dioxygenase family)
VNDIPITTEADGMPQRVVMNELVHRLESSGSVRLLFRALRSALAYRKLSGASIPELLRSALAMQRSEKLTRSQTLMAANAPILVKKAMVDGDPADGVLPSGMVSGVIDDRPSCAELIERIIAEAEQTLASLADRG